jgi:polygalacturonase
MRNRFHILIPLTWSICLPALLLIPVSASAQSVFDAHEFGTVGDGKTLDTAALQRAFDAAAAAGGGEVELRPGAYLTGALFLKSHTHLVLDKGAVILGTTRKDLYPLVPTRAAGIEMPWPAALLNIAGQTGVSVTGDGVIDGDGKIWWDEFWRLVPAYESRGLRWAVDYDVQRPELIRVYRSSKIQIGPGLLLRRSAFWTVHICYSTHVVVNGVTIRDNDPVDGRGPSTDGVDIDSSDHVLVEKVDIENNDDAICLKAGMNADGLRVNRPTENVVIRNSIVREAISGIAIGSDTAGGFNNIEVYGITILGGVRYGIYLKSTHTRGGWTQDVKMSHITMRGVHTALMIDLNYFPAFSTPRIPPGIEKNLPPELESIPSYWSTLAAPVPPALGTPHFRDITLSDIRAVDSNTAISANAAPDAPLERFILKHIDIEAQHAGSIRHTLKWKFEGTRIRASDGLPLKLEDDRQSAGTIVN